MRALTVLLTFALTFSLRADAQAQGTPPGPPTTPVEVVNDPLDVAGSVQVSNFPDPQNVVGSVEVTNTAANAVPVEVVNGTNGGIEVLITQATYTGDLGGPYGATEKCQAEFAGARLCSYIGDRLKVVAMLPDFGMETEAWVQSRDDEISPCSGWTSGSRQAEGRVLFQNGSHNFRSLLPDKCDIPRPIACCR